MTPTTSLWCCLALASFVLAGESAIAQTPAPNDSVADTKPTDDDTGEAAAANGDDATKTDDAAKTDDATKTDGAAKTDAAKTDAAKTDAAKTDDMAKRDGAEKTDAAAVDTWQRQLVEDGIERFRRPVDRLVEQTLGSTSRPVGFDWRDSWFQLAITGSELIERNNFGSFRLGGVVRKALGDFMIEGGASYVYVFGTPSSRLLALTPYIQPGRPSRVEFDVNGSYPLVEGVVTPLFDFVPPMEVVLSATAGARYLLYPEVIVGDRDWEDIDTWTNVATWQSVGTSLASPQLSAEDQLVIDRRVLGGMMLDPARLHTLLGLTVDVYMQPGLFLSLRALISVPVLAPVSGTLLGFWPELSVSLGYAF